MKKFLVSFCNTGIHESRFGLAIVGMDGSRFILDLPDHDLWASCAGFTGITKRPGGYLVGLQGTPHLLRLGPQLQFDGFRPVPGAVDIHGLVWHGDGPVVVCTGRDEVLHFRPSTVENIWSLETGGDHHHLNDIAAFGHSLIVSGFGSKTPNSLRVGAVSDVEDPSTPRLSGIREPHSVTAHDGMGYVLESSTGDIIQFNDESVQRVATCAGYLRGLSIGSDHVAIGRSAFRSTSRSVVGATRRPPADSRHDGDHEHEISGVYVAPAVTGPYQFVDLSTIGAEVYGIQCLEGAVVDPLNLKTADRNERMRDLIDLVDQLKGQNRHLRKALNEQRKP